MRKTQKIPFTEIVRRHKTGRLKLSVCLLFLTLNTVFAAPKTVLYTEGTFDLDHDGLSELLLAVQVSDGGMRLDYVEINKEQHHQTLWSFTPQAEHMGIFTDAQLIDLDGAGAPELVAALQTTFNGSEFNQPWLYIFQWIGETFTPVPVVIADEKLKGQFIRPGNLTKFPAGDENLLALSLGSPLRDILVLTVDSSELPWKLDGKYHLQPSLFKNGFGRVYATAFYRGDEPLMAVYSPEGNLLKTALYDLAGEPQEIQSDILPLEQARRLLSADILTTDLNGDGHEEILLPFQSGEVFLLESETDKLTLNALPLNSNDLFILPDPAAEQHINDIIIARVESGLYATIQAEPVEIAAISKAEAADIVIEEAQEYPAADDTITLGETYQLSVLTDSSEDFFSFKWLSSPPAGFEFDPATATLSWKPASEQIGHHPLEFKTEVRIGEKVLMIEDNGSVRHQITPVLTEDVTELAVLVEDSTRPAPIPVVAPGEPLLLELYSVAALIPAIGDGNRFVFSGVPPFGLTTAELNHGAPQRSLMHSIAADLSQVTENKAINFSYSSTQDSEDPHVTFTVIHDVTNNVMTMAFEPALAAVQQSLRPEDLFSELYQFPEYFFAGFREDTGIDLLGDKLQFSITDDQLSEDAQLSFVGITSPTLPTHLLTLYFNSGSLNEVRGEVKIQPTGGKKIITSFDFSGPFNPVRISTQLRSPATPSAPPAEIESGMAFIPPPPPSASRSDVLPEDTLEANGALRFYPGNYVKIYHNPAFDFSGGFTLEGWVNLAEENRSQVLISKEGSFSLALDDAGRLSFAVNRTRYDRDRLVASQILPLREWVHFAAVHDTAGMRLYENGVLITENDVTGVLNSSDEPIFFGGWDFFSGLLDEVRLSSDAIYHEDFQPVRRLDQRENTVGLWHCNEDSGFLIKDYSGFSNSGEIYGAEWIILSEENSGGDELEN